MISISPATNDTNSLLFQDLCYYDYLRLIFYPTYTVNLLQPQTLNQIN